MEYQKVGRGGAGNYYSQDDVANALKSTEVSGVRPCISSTYRLTHYQDVEAQHKTTEPTPEDIEKSRSAYAHSGRGGAGNYAYGTRLDEANALKGEADASLQESKPARTGYYGRGGAGNYRTGDTEKAEAERKVSIAQEEMHRKAVQDVEAELKEPEKVHLGGEKLEYENPR